MLKLKKEADFDKLFINTDYVFDVIFWVDTDYVKTLDGESTCLKHVIATQVKENGEIYIDLHVGLIDDPDCAEDMELDKFENGNEIRKQILDYLKENIEDIKYTPRDRKMISPQELEDINIKCCPECGRIFTKTLKINCDDLGGHVVCDECNSSFDI